MRWAMARAASASRAPCTWSPTRAAGARSVTRPRRPDTEARRCRPVARRGRAYNAPMENAALPRRIAGPLERTVLELRRIDRDAVWRRPRVGRTRLLLRESDALIDLIERCRERGDRLLPTQLWSAVVRFVGALDGTLRDELGINRHPAHVVDVLFATQGVLLEQRLERRALVLQVGGPRRCPC